MFIILDIKLYIIFIGLVAKLTQYVPTDIYFCNQDRATTIVPRCVLGRYIP
jgi:hypothetical protein